MSHWLHLIAVLVIVTTSAAPSNAKRTDSECNTGESCMDANDCPDYKRFLTLKGNERKMEIQRLKGKVCNKKPKRLCCKDTDTTNDPGRCMTGLKNDLPSQLPPADQCGVSCVGSSSVVRGEDASLGEFPWAALLGTEKVVRNYDNRQKKWVNMPEMEYHCGGTLINPWFVLTAAHCHQPQKKIVEVVLGESDILSDPDCPAAAFSNSNSCNNPKVQRKSVANVIIHQGYNTSNKASKNDIALVRMKTKAVFNIFVQPVCLPLPEYNLKNIFYEPVENSASATVVGWGQSVPRGQGANPRESRITHGLQTTMLQKGEIQIHPYSKCGNIDSSQLCANNDRNKTDSCRGDSGGGLFIRSDDYPGQSFLNVHVQVGVVSYGSRLCGDSPAVYTRVDNFIPWIKENIN